MKSKVIAGSVFRFEHFRDGKLIGDTEFHNKMTDEGLTYLADVGLSGGTPITAFYVVPFENNYSTPTGAETYAVPVFTESTAYSEATRQAFTEAGVASKQVTNAASKATLTFNATKTIYGAAIVGGGTAADTKGDTAGGGKLINVAYAGSGNEKAVESGDVLKISVTFTFADA